MGRMVEAEESKNFVDICNAQAEMIYDCCPTLQDTELLKTLGAEADPYSVVPMLMDVMEVVALADELAEWMGLSKGKEKNSSEDEVKNLSGAIR